MEKQATMIVRGEVQGVGYRYTVFHLAQQFKIFGTVRNLSDGTVEVIAEGEEADLKKFIEEIRLKRGGILVDSIEVHWKPFEGKFANFSIIRGKLF